ncbi:MAG TPA: hypothetical protein VHC40_14525 [Rhizomicrobium sp.]|jgi:hypothetical protein|nr:hypothetical protein [Rhizomicrobium sp.]
MAVMDHHDLPVDPEARRQAHCAAMFCLTWVGFFVAIGVVTWLASSL